MTRRRKYILFLLLIPVSLLVLVWSFLVSHWGLALALRLAAAVLPGTLSVNQSQGSLLGPISLSDLHYRDAQLKLTVRQLKLHWQASALFSGQLRITDLALAGVDLNLPAQQASTPTVRTGGLVLPFAIDLQRAEVRQLRIHTSPSSAPVVVDSVQIRARADRRRVQVRQFNIQAYHTEGRLSGEFQLRQDFPLKLSLGFIYRPDAKRQLKGDGKLQGDLRKLYLTQHLSGLLTADLDAQARDVLSALHWQAKLAIKQLDMHKLIANGSHVTVLGNVHAEGDLETLHSQSQLQVEDKRIGLARLQLKADSDLALTSYHWQAKGDFSGLELPAAKFDMAGSGDQQQLNISRLNLDALKGKIAGHARVSWLPRLQADAKLALQNLHTGLLARQWPGTLSAELALHSLPSDKGQPLHFSVHKLKGELRGFPLRGGVDGHWAPDRLVLQTMEVNLGGTRIAAHGELAHTWDLQFQAHSDKLSQLLPSLGGHFDLNGRLNGTAAKPRLIINGNAGQLAFAQNKIAELKLQLDMGLASRARAFLALEAKGVQTRRGHWNTVQVHSKGNNTAQHISLDAVGEQAQLHALLQGSFIPWRWQGQLTQLSYHRKHYGKWQLQRPVAVSLGQGQYRLSSLCLVQDDAHLCLQGQWTQDKHSALLDVKALPLHLLDPWLPQNVQLMGKLNAQAELHQTPQGALRANLSMHSPAKSVQIQFADLNERLTLGAGSLTAQLNDKGLQAALHLPLSEGGGVDSEVSLPGWIPQLGLPGTQAVQASLKLERIPADVITRFVPKTARAQGQLHADLHVSGSLGKPRLRGNAKWQGGSVLVPQLGIHIQDISAEIKSAQSNTVAFVVKARSGKGDVELDGKTRLIPEQGWPTTATLSSHNLEVSNIPEAFILVDSQLKIAMQGNSIHVGGDITIPRARLRPHSLPEGAVPVSPDIVIVHAGKQTVAVTRWLFSAHLNVQLGDQVDFNGFGIRGKLRGKLVLNDEPGKLVMGMGEVSIANGTYRLRGQDLTIRRGRLIFSNTFIDDPAVDVEAVRVVNTVTAGVRIKGTLKKPELTIFSEPTMSESDALAYLLFGHSFSQSTLAEGQSVSNAASAFGLVAGDYLAKGIGGRLGLDELRVDVNQTTQNTSLVLGKYLSPKLYLRYYTGIAESSRILQLQYQLSRRIQIQTESGYRGSQSITGGDIFFTVEY